MTNRRTGPACSRASRSPRLGITGIRFLGGEPMVSRKLRRDGRGQRRALRPRPEIAMTRNGIGLERRAAKLKAAGLDRINVSLDTVDAAQLRPDHPPRPAPPTYSRGWAPLPKVGADPGEGERRARCPVTGLDDAVALLRFRLDARVPRCASSSRCRSMPATSGSARPGDQGRRRAERRAAPATSTLHPRLRRRGLGARTSCGWSRRLQRGKRRHHRLGLPRVLRRSATAPGSPPTDRSATACSPGRRPILRLSDAHRRGRRRDRDRPGGRRCGPRLRVTASATPTSCSLTGR